MPASPVGVNGAIGDPATNQGTGALCTCIGFGYGEDYQTSAFVPAAFTTDSKPVVHRIGAAPTEEAFAANFTSKTLLMKTATGSVAPGAAVVAGWLNRTAFTLASGNFVFAVQA